MRRGHWEHLARRAARERRQAAGIRERRQRMVRRVEPELVAIPGWARKRAVKGLSQGETCVWLLPGDARQLERLDRECGGRPRVIETEFRRCRHCGRPVLGADAVALRGQDMAGEDWAGCSEECDGAREDRRWRRRDAGNREPSNGV
jgi:PAS domain-containing protein